MRTLDNTHAAPNWGVGTSENAVPEGLRKLGRLAVWAMAGAQFVDLIWLDGDESADRGRKAPAASRGDQLSQAELADLIGRARRGHSAGTPSQ